MILNLLNIPKVTIQVFFLDSQSKGKDAVFPVAANLKMPFGHLNSCHLFYFLLNQQQTIHASRLIHQDVQFQ